MKSFYILTVFCVCVLRFSSAGYVGTSGMASHLYNAADKIEPSLDSAVKAINNVLKTYVQSDGSINISGEEKQLPGLTVQAENAAHAIQNALKYLTDSLAKQIGTAKSDKKNIYVPDQVLKRFGQYMKQIQTNLAIISKELKTLHVEYVNFNRGNISSLEIETVPGKVLTDIVTSLNSISTYIRHIGYIMQELSAYLEEYMDITPNGHQNLFVAFYNALSAAITHVADNISKHIYAFTNSQIIRTNSKGNEETNAFDGFTKFNILLEYLEKEANITGDFLGLGKTFLNDVFHAKA